jgi:two-component system cell cycle sensor histidine kinase/response regulator CckA
MSGMTPRAVLVVEDEQELRSLFAMLLEGEEFTVYQAQDGQVALDMLHEHSAEIGLVITDLGLPHLGGVDLIAKARVLNPSVRIIGTSGLSGAKIREMVMRAGADAFLPKPCSVQEVLRTVREIMK